MRFASGLAGHSVTLPWAELDELVGGLPDSAYNHAAFWSGERPSWRGYRTRDVRIGESVTFTKFVGESSDVPRHATPRSPRSTHQVSARQQDVHSDVDIVLIGCVKEKTRRPAAAKDLYTSPLYVKERTYAEATGATWFILSAEHGLLEPDEVVAPYDVRLSQTPWTYRDAWGLRVFGRLLDICGPIQGKTIEIHAGSAYTDPIRELLLAEGATVIEPLAGMRLGHRLSWYNSLMSGDETSPLGSSSDLPKYAELLRDASSARTPAQFLATKGAGVHAPGLYSWWVDQAGSSDLTAGLGHVIEPGMVYAGLAGATRERTGMDSSNTLWLRISKMHLGSRHEFSTFRLSLGSALADPLGWSEIDEEALTSWMHAHLQVIAVPVADRWSLGRVESAVLAELDPPLNLRKVSRTELRSRLIVLRRQYSRKKRRVR